MSDEIILTVGVGETPVSTKVSTPTVSLIAEADARIALSARSGSTIHVEAKSEAH